MTPHRFTAIRLLAAGIWAGSLLPLGQDWARAAAATSQPATSSPASDGNLQECFEAMERLGIRGDATVEQVEAILRNASQMVEAARQADQDATDKGNRRERLCSLELLLADLHREAAGVLTGQAADGPFDQALKIYRQARMDYRDVAIGMMGYIGEAKVLRARGRAKEARSALRPVQELVRKPTSPVQAELSRIAAMESLEILLVENPEEALQEISTWRASRTIAQDADWSARGDWLAARAAVARLARGAGSRLDGPAHEQQLNQALAALRTDSVMRAASPRERLELILQLESRARRPLLSAAEAAEWADILAGAGAAKATEFYRRAAETDAASMSVDSCLRYAALLVQSQSYQPAVAWCEKIAQRGDASEAQRMLALRFASACLVQLFRTATAPAERQNFGSKALAILTTLLGREAPPEQRGECLSQWVEVMGGLKGVAACVPMLESRSSLVDQDAYLLYALAAGRWELSQRERAKPTRTAQSRPSSDDIVLLLEKAIRLAGKDRAADLQGRIVLQLVSVKSNGPQPDKRAALGLLIEWWDQLVDQPQLVQETVQARLGLLVDLGLTEDALKFLESLPAESAGRAGSALLSLASILADRFESVSADSREPERQRIRWLCQRAVAGTDAQSYGTTCLAAARILLRTGAGRDARALLEGLAAQPQGAADAKVSIESRLLTAEAFGQEGKLNEAIAICDKLLDSHPSDHEVLMTRGRLGLAARNPADAASWFRKAREANPQGSVEWCEATLGLLQALLQDGRAAEVAGILRVGLAMYPDFGNPQLLSSAKKLQEKVAGANGHDFATP